ncbi:MBL fold metallo-hydrolase [Vallitalea sp.]|jgi:glyoxylase-like metal-dependent hydrolase (beta-lactamase superfamily II)|uniref:MBL fold metallo-hydrolase n=1 Tax=Vallitalea sp. TaxID=1882829 RepID=UPI0025D114B2|nr:MBL fold metallo-hydrolase [Vallitalea sp.]MCT4687596.1 MBL fold metallo-hydrolase [Vallitalea sp.]
MKVKTMMLGILQTNVYIVYDEESKEAVVIDPAGEEDRIIRFIEETNLRLMGILVTHGHFDHIGVVDAIRNNYGVPVFTSREEGKLMADPNQNLSLNLMRKVVVVENDEVVGDKDILEFGELVFECIVVPGHSPESVCYYNRENDILFCGDTLFAGSIGRTDFYDGPQNTLINNIKDRLMSLPEETKVYPGHGFQTTIGYEKKTNIYMC